MTRSVSGKLVTYIALATIRPRKQADGITRYTAIVRVRKGVSVVHQEAKTFAHVSAAKSWARHREVMLENPDELRRAQDKKQLPGMLTSWAS